MEDLLLRDEVVDLPNPPLRDLDVARRAAITRFDFMFWMDFGACCVRFLALLLLPMLFAAVLEGIAL